MSMGKDHWAEFYRVWSQLGPPLRPNHEVVAAIREQVGSVAGRALLLGVTPELTDVCSQVVAVDKNHAMIANLWAGNTPSRWAVVGNWLMPSFRPGFFAVCIGDGSLNQLIFPGQWRAFCQVLFEVLLPGGKLVCRTTTAPDKTDTVESIKDAALSGAIGNFHAFKMRLSMAIALEQQDPCVAVKDILGRFNQMFADRDELARRTGWRRDEIDTIDAYKGSQMFTNRPTCPQVLSVFSPVFPDAHFVPSGTYEMANRCPLLVLSKR